MSDKKKYIAAVSAGPDSMYMLYKYFKKIAIVCHVNYHDREDTNNDEQIIRKFCKKKNIPIYVLDVKENDYANILKKNLQSKYRQIRFNFFETISNKNNIYNLMIGHNFDDNLETAYMQILKGKTPLFYGLNKNGYYNKLKIFRPLLNIWKADIYSKCLKLKIDFAFDYSNENLKFYRNSTRLILENIDRHDKVLFINLINKENKINKEKHIEFIYIQWKKNNFTISYYLSIYELNKKNVLYMFLSELNIKKINGNKLKYLDNFILNGKIDSSYRVDSNVAIFKTKSNIKITYNNL